MFSPYPLTMLYTWAYFQVANWLTLQYMNYFLVLSFGQVTSDGRTDGRTESDAYEPTVHMHRCAQKCPFTESF